MTTMNLKFEIVKTKTLDYSTTCDMCRRVTNDFFIVRPLVFNATLRFCLFCLETAITNDSELGQEVLDYYVNKRIQQS